MMGVKSELWLQINTEALMRNFLYLTLIKRIIGKEPSIISS